MCARGGKLSFFCPGEMEAVRKSCRKFHAGGEPNGSVSSIGSVGSKS